MEFRCLIFFCILLVITNSAVGKKKKYKQLIDELQQKGEKQTKDISDLFKVISELRVKLASSDERLEELESKEEGNANKPVIAFSARVQPSYNDIQPWATIKFAYVETNLGNAYDASTGEFTAPQAGAYVFYSNILSGTNIIETSLQINGTNKLWLYSAGSPSHGSGSNLIVVHLNVGDKVKMVKHGPWGTKPFYIHHRWSTFSGYMINSD